MAIGDDAKYSGRWGDGREKSLHGDSLQAVEHQLQKNILRN